MISLTCTNCRSVLTMDDAFAGGVCRCQHCGTIQTVPSSLKEQSNTGAGPATSKALYQKSQAADVGMSGTGLDELADVVASSGLARSALKSTSRAGANNATRRVSKAPPALRATAAAAAGTVATVGEAPPRAEAGDVASLSERRTRLLMIGGGGAVALLLVAVVVALLLRGGGSQVASGPNGGGNGSNSEPVIPSDGTNPLIRGPSFGMVDLSAASSVVYVLDRSQANDDIFDTLKAATYRSARSLGPDKRFAIVFWNNQSGDRSFPEQGLTSATPEQIKAAEETFDDLTAFGQSDLRSALADAVSRGPGAIVLATAKTYIDEENLLIVDEVTVGKPVVIHTFALGDEDKDVLKQIAEKTGGQYRKLPKTDLLKLTN